MAKLLVAGSSGLAGRGIVRFAKKMGIYEVVEVNRKICDFSDPQATRKLFEQVKPDVVIDAAAKVGGIYANSKLPVNFLIENLQIQNNIFTSCFETGVERLIFLSSSCVYPKLTKQPILEGALMTGVLEDTNSAYAVAKIAGMKLIESYQKQYNLNWISVMPTNLYGPHDNFSKTLSHVLPALIRKFHDGRVKNTSVVTLWGDGSPRREFMHVDDFSRALFTVIEKYHGSETINIGTGTDISIRDLSIIVKDVVGYEGETIWDSTKPNGVAKRLLDVTKLSKLGFSAKIELENGIEETYEWYRRTSDIHYPEE